MPTSSAEDQIVQMMTIAAAWEKLRRDKTFDGITLEQFKATLQKSVDAHAEVTRLEGQMRAMRALLEKTDARTLTILENVEAEMKSARKKSAGGTRSKAAAGKTKPRRKTSRARKSLKG